MAELLDKAWAQANSRNPRAMVFYGLVNADGESVIEFFATREEAEA